MTWETERVVKIAIAIAFATTVLASAALGATAMWVILT